jgi:sec-independent protein translocase protein TatA
MLLFIGTAEVIFIVFIVLLLFGSKKIPEVARAMGKGLREFQKATDEIKREISKADISSTNESHSQNSPNQQGTDKSTSCTDNQQK